MLEINYPFDWMLMLIGLYLGLHFSRLVYYYLIVKWFNMDQNDFNMFKSIDKQATDMMGDYKDPGVSQLLFLWVTMCFSGCFFLSMLFPPGISMFERIVVYMFVFIAIYVLTFFTLAGKR